ncbi:hypothetical protein FPOA_07849 [Fusarium poae]|uniref:Uncharacterized protein n=1 Tax=Fusarium poae TaxID=36050 RepID=A0A1B8ALU8_FUSPO|nr:hypothetical protein FPOA_07849 [Fusarium poae]
MSHALRAITPWFILEPSGHSLQRPLCIDRCLMIEKVTTLAQPRISWLLPKTNDRTIQPDELSINNYS